jgi:hypothetical protein
MSKKKTIILPAIPLQKENVKDAKEDVKEINLSKFAKELEGKNISHIQRERETIYIYPDYIPKDRINEKEGKQFRGNKRSRLKRFSDNLFYSAKIGNVEECKKIVSEFDSFYKEFYRINDYSLSSLSSSNDPAKNKDIQLFLSLLLEIKG